MRENSILDVKDLDDLAVALGTTTNRLRGLLYGTRRLGYQTKSIKKKSGGTRTLAVPPRNIAVLQRSLLEHLRKLRKPSTISFGSEAGRSAVSSADGHINQRWIFSIDLENFFPSIHFGRVMGLFLKRPFQMNRAAARTVAQLLCYEKMLPQGASTSPIVANMIARSFDRDLFLFARKHRAWVTRFVDDISFSSHDAKALPNFCNDAGEPSLQLEAIIRKHGFHINAKKTRLMPRGTSQTVVGIKVNTKRNISKPYHDSIRGALKAWESHGYQAAQGKYSGERRTRSSRKHEPAVHLNRNLLGRIEYVGHVKGHSDSSYRKLIRRYSRLEWGALSDRQRRIAIVDYTPSQLGDDSVFKIHNFEHKWNSNEDSSVLGFGNAILVAGIGVVTCKHCVKPNAVLTSKSGKTYQIESYRPSTSFDVAILSVPDLDEHLEQSRLLPLSQKPKTGDLLTVIGFTEERDTTLHIAESRIAQMRNISEIEHINLKDGIFPGKSGSAVVNQQHELVGIAMTGYHHTNDGSDYLVFPIDRLRDAIEGSASRQFPRTT